MKKLSLILGIAVLLLPLAAVAADSTWTGEVLDLKCYENGQKGEGHASCAKRCLGGGGAMGLLVDGEVVHIDTAASDATAVETLKAAGGEIVTVTGELADKDGEKVVTVASAKSEG